MLAMLSVLLYSLSQFFIFFLRDNIVILWGLKQAQVTALVLMVLTLPIIAHLLRKQRLSSRAPDGGRAAETHPAPSGQPAASAGD
jgi:hypothetical protein